MFHSKPISNYTMILLEEFYEMTADGDSLLEINPPPSKNLKSIYFGPLNGLVEINEDNYEKNHLNIV